MRRTLSCLAMVWLVSCLAWRAHAQTELRVGPVRTVISATRFEALQLPIFPDGSIFPLRMGHETYFFGAQGGARDSVEQGLDRISVIGCAGVAVRPLGRVVEHADAALGGCDGSACPEPTLRLC